MGILGWRWGVGGEGRWEKVLPLRGWDEIDRSGQELGFYTVVDISITIIFRDDAGIVLEQEISCCC